MGESCSGYQPREDEDAVPSDGGRLNYAKATRLYASEKDVPVLHQKASQELKESGDEKVTNNFITECFFLAHELLHMGLRQAVNRDNQLIQRLGRMQDELRARPNFHPLKNMMNNTISEHITLQAALLSPTLSQELLAFYDWTCSWILDLQELNDPSLDLVPEYYIEDIVEWLDYCSKFQGTGRTTHQGANNLGNTLQCLTYYEGKAPRGGSGEGLLRFMVKLMAGKYAIKNPHLRSKFPQALSLFIPREPRRPGQAQLGAFHRASPDHIFNTHPLVRSSLIPALCELYVECEFGERQFYNKFGTRHLISAILKYLWDLEGQRRTLVTLSEDLERFIPFLNMLGNDVVFLLDHGLDDLAAIRNEQIERADTVQWNRQPQHTIQERNADFRRREGGCASMMNLANSAVNILFYITRVIKTPFVCPEFVPRMASITLSAVDKLVGPKVSELKVDNKAQYNFHPRSLLREICGVIVNLSESREFLIALASEEQFYKPRNLNKALRLIRKWKMMRTNEEQQFEAMIGAVAQAYEEVCEAEEDLGDDIPEEYLDPIMGVLMVDPVKLPSGNVLDRSTIKRHLLNLRSDPFNRQPLSLDMLQEVPEFKAELDAWVTSKRQSRREEREQKAKLAELSDDDDDDEVGYKEAEDDTQETRVGVSADNQNQTDLMHTQVTSSSSSSAASSSLSEATSATAATGVGTQHQSETIVSHSDPNTPASAAVVSSISSVGSVASVASTPIAPAPVSSIGSGVTATTQESKNASQYPGVDNDNNLNNQGNAVNLLAAILSTMAVSNNANNPNNQGSVATMNNSYSVGNNNNNGFSNSTDNDSKE